MSTCTTCRHWTRAKRKEIGTCEALVGIESDTGGWAVFAADGELGRGFHPFTRNVIGTPQGFGCTLHEPNTLAPHPSWKLL